MMLPTLLEHAEAPIEGLGEIVLGFVIENEVLAWHKLLSVTNTV